MVSTPLPLVDDPFSIPLPEVAVAGSLVYFSHSDAGHGQELWAVRWDDIFSDGFESGDLGAWTP